jgi:hypothetical protein
MTWMCYCTHFIHMKVKTSFGSTVHYLSLEGFIFIFKLHLNAIGSRNIWRLSLDFVMLFKWIIFLFLLVAVRSSFLLYIVSVRIRWPGVSKEANQRTMKTRFVLINRSHNQRHTVATNEGKRDRRKKLFGVGLKNYY